MSDCINVPFHERHANPTDPGVHLTFGEGEWATFQRFLCRGAAGAAYDATTRVGCPLVGQGGGVYVADDANSYVQGVAYAAGVAMSGECELTQLPSIGSAIVLNGAQHMLWYNIAGQLGGSLNGGGTLSSGPANLVGRGPVHWALTHDGVNQHFWLNRRDVAQAAAALGVPAGTFQIGRRGTARRVRFHPTQPNVAAMYLRDFARRVVYAWKPQDCGEGPAGGIPTNAVGEGDWFCALGAAGLRFDYVRSARLANGAALALVNAGALGNERLAFMATKQPAFGSWSWAFLASDLTCQPMMGLAPYRTTGLTDAGGGTYYTLVQVVAGAWQATLHRDNGAALLTVTHPAVAAVGDLVGTRFSRDVSGTWRLRLIVNGVVASSAAAVVDVTYLNSSYIVVSPRRAQVLGHIRHQSEAEPEEVPVPRW